MLLLFILLVIVFLILIFILLLLSAGNVTERVESLETVHHLYIALRKGYLAESTYQQFRDRYHECVRMLNGLERTVEQQLDPNLRVWPDNL